MVKISLNVALRCPSTYWINFLLVGALILETLWSRVQNCSLHVSTQTVQFYQNIIESTNT